MFSKLDFYGFMFKSTFFFKKMKSDSSAAAALLLIEAYCQFGQRACLRWDDWVG